MAALHHVSIALDDLATWAVLLDAVEDGDSVVLLDAAASGLQGVGAAIVAVWCDLVGHQQRAMPATRWMLPDAERIVAASALPPGILAIADAHWLALIVEHPRLLEWN